MTEPTIYKILMLVLHLFLVLALSPFINGLMKKVKAQLQGRQGPPLMQCYADLNKYFNKESVVSTQASWLFFATPFIVFSATLVASLVIPTYVPLSPLNWMGGIIVFVYLLGLARFFTALAAMEPGSGFCGMASSREMMLGALIEPVMLLSLFVLGTMAGTTNLAAMVSWFAAQGVHLYSPAYFLAVLAFFVVSIAEMGRVPFDNPETHYELTMIHEGLLLEYSGKPLGLMFWSAWNKQFLMLSLFANLLPPWTVSHIHTLPGVLLAVGLFLVKILVISLFVVMVETTVAKVRLFRVKDILGASFVLAIIALVLSIHQIEGLMP